MCPDHLELQCLLHREAVCRPEMESAILQAVTVRATGRGCRWTGCTEVQHPQSLEADVETRVEPVLRPRGLRWMSSTFGLLMVTSCPFRAELCAPVPSSHHA